MSEENPLSALRRKAQVGQQQYQARSMTAPRALRLSMAKVAEDEFDLALGVIGLTESCAAAADVVGAAAENTLMLLLDTPNGGPGAALFDSTFVGALVQQQTMGRVSEIKEGAPPRRTSRTDASLVGPYLDLIFRKAGPLPDDEKDSRLLSGIKFGAHMPAPRLLLMALEAPEYLHFTVTVDIAMGTCQGRMDLLLPRPDARSGAVIAGAVGADSAGAPSELTLEKVVMTVQAQLQVALCRLRLPFSEISAFAVGDTLTLPQSALNNAEILTLGGRKVGHGKLGQIEGRRAIKLSNGSQVGDTPQRRGADSATGAPSVQYSEDPRGQPSMPSPTLETAAPSGMLQLPPADLGSFPGDTPEIDTGVGLPDLPDIPGMADSSGLSDLPDIPSFDGSDALPELPSMDAGVDLPNLPDLPDLPSLAQSGS